MKIYPAIDLIEGKVVRLSQGRFEAQTTYHDAPLDLARDFAERGAAYLHVVDLDGARAGRPQQLALLKQMASASALKLQVGGGVRTADDVEALLTAGVDRVVIGSLAVQDAESTVSLFQKFGAARITLSLDVMLADDGSARVATHGWREVSVLSIAAVIDRYLEFGLEQILCTDISKDGMMGGPNFILYQKMQKLYPSLCCLASGGVRDLRDLQQLRDQGLGGAIIGRALYEGNLSLEEAVRC